MVQEKKYSIVDALKDDALKLEWEKKEEQAKKLETQITRANNWEELFNTKKQEAADFLENVIKPSQFEYEANETLKSYKIEKHLEGDLHIFKRKRTMKGYSTTFQKLNLNGNVKMVFKGPNNEINEDVIIPEAGNVNHNFTIENTILPDLELFEKIPKEELQKITKLIPSELISFIKGKPATKSWEKTMLVNGYLPQRIGHRIYPDFILKIQVELKEKYPDLFKNTMK